MIEHEGKQYARVTSDILSPFSDFSGIDPKVLANKAALGTAVHDAISDSLKGIFHLLPEGGEGYFYSFLKWRKAAQAECVVCEERFFDHEKMFTGKIDLLAKLPGKMPPILCDFKTSVSESRTVWPMQAHLYAHLLKLAGREIQSRFLFIKLDKEGKPPVVYDYPFSVNTMAKCLRAVDDFWSKQTDVARNG